MSTTPAATDGEQARRRLTAGRVFANAEARAVAVLVRAQFRYDNRFRLTVLSILPLTLVYMLSGFKEGGLDPFSTERQGQTLVYMGIAMFPPMLRAALTQSDAFRAAWVFHGTPADKRALVMSLKDYVAAWFIVPYVTFISAIYVVATGRPLMVAVHMMVLGLISHLLLTVDFILNPEVPFSKPPSRGARTRTTFAAIMIAALVGALLPLGLAIVYEAPLLTAAAVAALALFNAVAQAGLRFRLAGIEKVAQFDM